MVSSIYFPKKGDGYLYTKPERPGAEPKKDDWRYRTHDWKSDKLVEKFDKKKFDNDHERWEADKKYYEENKGQFTNRAAKYLIGKKFNFEPGKVNIIFGPNGCGKTTILRAIAGNAGIEDGMPKLVGPIDAFGFGDDKSLENYKKTYIHKLMKNTATVVWDGNIIYYDNFASTLQTGFGGFGGLVGSALGSIEDEVTFRIGGSKLSSGQKAGWLFNKVSAIQEAGLTLKNITEDRVEKRVNDVWRASYKAQTSYFSGLENYDKKVPMTILFDEPEVNFDIPTVWGLYTQVFPGMCKEHGTQIITVSHSPIVLSDGVMNNELVNIVSLDEEYTKKVKTFLGKLSF